MIEYDKLQKSLKHLQLQFENYRTFDSSQPELLQEAVAESVIQRFEICYDCMWKTLKRYLIEELGIPEVPNSPKPVFRLAFENDLFSAPVERWLEFADARTSTAHDYSGEKAKAALELMSGFISNAIDLYQTMSGEPWQ
ncbi:MAG TPA: nucleotidyltransferase substrate binding protein [Candidatus Rifleibacterium sp.]|nr:nucleotidyltransferase substrate binding protein [Candidatus Rifleibacterium sp.]